MVKFKGLLRSSDERKKQVNFLTLNDFLILKERGESIVKKIFFVLLMVLLLSISTASAATLVNGLGGSAGFGENVLPANDDGSTAFLDLSSIFSSGLNFYGTTYTGLYLNNNGNVTFSSAMGTYTPYALVGPTGNPIIAPYFADVDTWGGAATPTLGGTSTGSNLLYWDLDTSSNIYTATWDDVGYYSSYTDLLNAFQLALINRDDTGTGNFDIVFRYEDINWTTGGASGGSGGLGGTVARAGWNSGNGTNFFELPQSGDQSAMLALETATNISDPGVYLFQVRGGQVIPTDPIPEPATMLLLGSGLIGLAGLGRKKFFKKS